MANFDHQTRRMQRAAEPMSATDAPTAPHALLTQNIGGDGYPAAELLCPRCGSEYLHHAGITTYERAAEDGPSRVTALEAGAIRVAYPPSHACRNPSSRRDGIAIRFWCESCSVDGLDDLELTLAQHKGVTQIEWRFPSRVLEIAT